MLGSGAKGTDGNTGTFHIFFLIIIIILNTTVFCSPALNCSLTVNPRICLAFHTGLALHSASQRRKEGLLTH